MENGKLICFVGGTFTRDGGKESGLVNKIFNELLRYFPKDEIILHNGGNSEDIPNLLQEVKGKDYVFWWANVLDLEEKHRNVKEVNPYCMFIGSKRNNNEYSFAELLLRSLEQKHNLCIEFSKQDKVNMRIFDPLGNVFFDGQDIPNMVCCLVNRMKFLKSMKRIASIRDKETITIDRIDPLFLELIKGYAETFHELIQTQTSRFLGNCSTRCMRGFPSQRINDLVYVSRRNVDKRYIDENAFVPCRLQDEHVIYFNDNKPSVDTPIQLELYKQLPKINFMIHSHCYIENAPFTSEIIPCGAIQEINQILDLISEDNTKNLEYFVVNLKGHGSTIMANKVEDLRDIKYIPRILPENQIDWNIK